MIFIRIAKSAFLSFCVLTAYAQVIDTTQINADNRHAYVVHEDSAEFARQLCFNILERASRSGYLKGEGDACVTLGAIFRNNNQFRESYAYLYRALKIRRMLGDSNRVAAVYTNVGINMARQSRYDSAIATVLYAIKIIESLPNPDNTVLGSEYLLLSNIFDEYLEPDDALKYAKLSLAAYIKTDREDLIGKANYTLGNRFLTVEKPDSSLIYYNVSFNNFAASSKDPDYLANILINKAIIYTKKGNIILAEKLYAEAEKQLERLGEDADFFHFYLNKSDCMIQQNRWTEALTLLRKIYPDYIEDLGFLDRQFLFENLASAYFAVNKPDSAFLCQKEAYSVRDSIYNDRKRKEFIRFQAERYKKETLLEQAHAQKQLFRARFFLSSSGMLLLLLILLIYAFIQRKRLFDLLNEQRNLAHKREVDELIRNSEMRYLSAGIEGRELEKEMISRDLHDNLGSAIVTLSWQHEAILENTSPKSKIYSHLVKHNAGLKKLYQDTRHIAHQLGSGVLERAGLIPVLNELCSDIESSKKIEVNFSSFGMEARLPHNQELNILRVIQELVSNILKYSHADQLMLQINRLDDIVNIMIEDNGVGFAPAKALAAGGAGLGNVETRIRNMNSTIQFENRPAGGTTIIINIPIPKPEKFYEQAN